MKKIQIFGMAAILMIGLVAAGAFAFGSRNGGQLNQPEDWAEQRTAIEAALDAGDYNAWVVAHEAMDRQPRFFSQVTEENFARFAEMHEAMQTGDFETANTIASELGIERGPNGGQGKMAGARQGQGMRSGNGQGKGMHRGSGQGCMNSQ